MSIQVTTAHAPVAVVRQSANFHPSIWAPAPMAVVRQSANFHPSIWGDRFIAYNSNNLTKDDIVEKQIEELKEEIKMKFIVAATADRNSRQIMHLIDTIQRLGLGYHFAKQIEEGLEHVYGTYNIEKNDDNLYHVALLFRLLRQQGHNISCDVFNKFKDNNTGGFKDSLVNDVMGILSLYEASQLRVHGEKILDEALAFSINQLESMKTRLIPPLKTQVINALKQPIHKSIQRLETRKYIDVYQEIDLHDKTLLKLAKLDFNLLLKFHQKELSHITIWWKDLDFASKMPFARDRVVECYFWILGFYAEPEYCVARMILTKVIAMTSYLDDIYDAYGTMDELVLLTEAIDRWDISAIDQLPEYIKIYYKALLDVYEEIEKEMAKQGRSYRHPYAKEVMKVQAKAYFEEAKWLNKEGYMPTMEEYMRVASISSGLFILLTTSLLGMGDLVTKETFEWIFSRPKMVKASEIIGRLLNDMMSQLEKKRAHIPTSIECYMKQYGVSEQEAHKELHNRVEDAWKDINEECLKPTAVPMPVLMCMLNFTRTLDFVYKEEDGYTNAGVMLEDAVSSLLIDPVQI